MAVRISSTRNRSTRVEPLGGALVLFDHGIAELGDDVRPGVLTAARRRGYRISDDDPATPAPKRRPRTRRPAPAAPPVDDAGDQLDDGDVDEDQADELVDEPAAAPPAP